MSLDGICFPVSSVEPGFHLQSDSALLRSVQSVVPFSDFWTDITADGLIIIMRICDVLFAFPGLILAIAIVAILGSGMTNVVIAVAVFSTPTFARLVRSKTLSLKNSVFVLAARNIGVSDARILFHHILPGAIPDIIVQYSMSFGSSILTASSLSFLGMGAQPPTPEWGLLLSNGRNYMASAMYVTIFPGLAIFLTVLSFNLLGDGLRDALDPKLSD